MKIAWNEKGSRRYEIGIDRGVLYPKDSPGVPWNGLVSLDDSVVNGDVSAYYFDGVKYLEVVANKEYQAALKAFTYPEEFDAIQGSLEVAPGISIHDQNQKTFDLSYRTLLGNDTAATDYGYKIHFAYNLTAVRDTVSYNTLGSDSSASDFGWTVSGVPVWVSGYKPAVHFSIDSRKIPSEMLADVEAILYGTETKNPSLPDFQTLLGLVTVGYPRYINANPTTGLSLLVDGDGDLADLNEDGIYKAMAGTRLVESSTEGFYELE